MIEIFIKNRKLNQGFTLIELLVVIAIIGIFAGIVLVTLGSVRTKSNDVGRVQDIKQIQTALELYALDHDGEYPQLPSGLPGGINSNQSEWNSVLGVALQPYISKIVRPTSGWYNYYTGGNSYWCAISGANSTARGIELTKNGYYIRAQLSNLGYHLGPNGEFITDPPSPISLNDSGIWDYDYEIFGGTYNRFDGTSICPAM